MKTYKTASEWLTRGCSVIPLSRKTKRPAVKWKRYQTSLPTERDLRGWFLHRQSNLAVIFGEISDGLCSMDFDELETFERWTRFCPELAETLPIVETRRGRHVYFRATPESIIDVRRELGRRTDAHGAIQLECGELRCGVGCYSVLPPSVHPSGFEYRWIREPGFPLPTVDPACFVEELIWRRAETIKS